MPQRIKTELSASGMADIAFLLLIFFLVATTFLNEKGVKATLPIHYEGPPGKMPDNQVLNIKINRLDEVMVEGTIIPLHAIQEEVKTFIGDPNKEDSFSEKAVISLQHDQKTSYKAYIIVYASIKKAYDEMRNELAQQLYQQDFDGLLIKNRNKIIKKLPIKISEAEPYLDYN